MTISVGRVRSSLTKREMVRDPQRVPIDLPRLTTPARTKLRAAISGIASYLPPEIVTSEQVEERISTESEAHGYAPASGIVSSRTGVKTRRFAARDVDASDLAVAAVERALTQAGRTISEVDLLIFASTSQDLVEPATSHIVSDKLGSRAVVFDVKNACNSFIQALQVADSLMRTGSYKCAVVCTGEKPSAVIRWDVRDDDHLKQSFAGYTFGDAGAAAVLEPRRDGTGLDFIEFEAASQHWETCTMRGGGTMHPREFEHMYFTGNGNALRDAFIELGPKLLLECFEQTKTTFDDYDLILFHQVSTKYLDAFHEVSGVPRDKIICTVDSVGNIASATMPLQLELALADGRVKAGSRVMWIGLGAGISLGVATMRL